jgi:hypothetical protein
VGFQHSAIGSGLGFLFSIRAHPVGKTYINRTIIPALCARACGVPEVGLACELQR